MTTHPRKSSTLSASVPIRVDRSVPVSYPDFVKQVVHPELEAFGPAEYSFARVQLFVHDNQKIRLDKGRLIVEYMSGDHIYSYLRDTNTLRLCLGLAVALAIQSGGIAVFRRFFGEVSSVLFWKSLAQLHHGGFYVPFLSVQSNKIRIGWLWRGSGLLENSPAACFNTCS